MSLIQLTLDEQPNRDSDDNINKTDYEQELIAIWENHVKTDGSGVYVCSVLTEVKVRRQRKKINSEAAE
jgi:hypothetical protein